MLRRPLGTLAVRAHGACVTRRRPAANYPSLRLGGVLRHRTLAADSSALGRFPADLAPFVGPAEA
jgi:hypothetical protein